jgi:predicted transposase/invertase (TIGR01784 family)
LRTLVLLVDLNQKFVKRDSIFYKIFQQFPTLLFELLETPPQKANEYRFDSIEVKEPTFRIDGVFIPPPTANPATVYFCEVQFQKDEQLYERLFAESHLYFYRNRQRFQDWATVVIYPSRNIEQADTRPYRSLLNGDQVHRIYLDELGNIRQLTPSLGLMVLTTLPESQAPEEARYLLAQVESESVEVMEAGAIIELVTTIMVYKFSQLTRQEVEAMLELDLKQTKVFQEAKEEGRLEGQQELKLELVKALLAKGMSVKEIASLLKLPIEQVQQVASS